MSLQVVAVGARDPGAELGNGGGKGGKISNIPSTGQELGTGTGIIKVKQDHTDSMHQNFLSIYIASF